MKNITEKQLIENLKNLKDILGHEPNVFEIDVCKKLPTARTIQRRFGGMEHVRQLAGFEHMNHTKGSKRSQIASESLLRSSEYESDIINKLFKRHHNKGHSKGHSKGQNKVVIRHYAYQQYLPDKGHYINITCDAAVNDVLNKHIYLFDFFFPSNHHSLAGCVRSKLKKLKEHPPNLFDTTYSITFVCINPDITVEDIKSIPTNLGNIELLDHETFKQRWL